MVKKLTITFQEAEAPIAALVTKFGGQPTWLAEPQWPLSRATGEPMRFICQIALDETIFGAPAGRMAYFFISDGPTFVDNTFDPDRGENALIIQPAGVYEGQTKPVATGPTLQRWVEDDAQKMRRPIPCELSVTLQPGEDPESFEDANEEMAGGRWDENKIGGTPAFLQYEEYPQGGPWKLLLQLDSASVPFEINFGDAGIGYGFISEDGRSGKFMWQCA